MSRDTALVSADWAEKNLDADRRRLRRGRRGHRRLRRRPHPGRRQARLEDRPAGPGPPRLRQQGAVRGAALGEGHRQRRHRRPVRRQQQLVRRVRVLVLQALRPRRRPAARRRAQEVGAGRAPARRRTVPQRAGDPVHSAEPDLSIRAFRDEVVAAIGSKNLVDVRSPDEYAGRLLAPAHLPQEQSQRAGHIPTARQRAVVQGRQRGRHLQVRRRAARRCTPRRASTRPRTRSRTAGSASVPAHTWFVLKELLGHRERQELRRFVDRVRLAGRRAGREGLSRCAAPPPRRHAGTELSRPWTRPRQPSSRAAWSGTASRCRRVRPPARRVRRVHRRGGVRATGQFRFFAAPGRWTVRALSRAATASRSSTPASGSASYGSRSADRRPAPRDVRGAGPAARSAAASPPAQRRDVTGHAGPARPRRPTQPRRRCR